MRRQKGFFASWLESYREKLESNKEQYLIEKNLSAHKSKDIIGTSNKVVESFVAPPSFLLYLWAAFPLFFIATFQVSTVLAAIVATVINYILIHLDTFQFIRYVMAGFVLLVVLILYQINVI